MNELRECPFCGSTLVELQIGYHMKSDAKVGCLECSAEGPLFGTDDSRGERDWSGQAIAAWNRRASDTFTVTPAGKAALRGES